MPMDRIMMIGHNVVGEGGIMKCEHDATLRLKSVIVQTNKMGSMQNFTMNSLYLMVLMGQTSID